MENLFFFEGKITGQTLNQFIIIKLITTILMYVSRLKKKSFLFFFLFSHTQIISLKDDNTLHSPFSFLLHTQLSLSWLSFFSFKRLPLGCSLFSLSFDSLFSSICSNPPCCCSHFPLAFLPSENPFSLSWFHALFSLFP